MSLEEELLAVLKQHGASMRAYQIAEVIEDRWEQEGLTSKFLFWTYPKQLPFGTLYRALDALADRGLIQKRWVIASNGRPTTLYSVIENRS